MATATQITQVLVPAPKLPASSLTVEQRRQITQAVQDGYTPAGLVLFGFTTTDIRNYLFGTNSGSIGLAEAEAIQRITMGLQQTPTTNLAGALIDPKRLVPGAGSYDWGWGDIPWGIKHLSEHPAGSHYHGDLGSFLDSTFRVLTGVFTLGASEIPFGNSRLGVKSGVQSLLSTQATGGAIQSEAPSKQIALIEKIVGTGASLVSGGAALFAAPEVVAGQITARSAAAAAEFTASESLGTVSTASLQTARLGLAEYAGTTPQAISIASVEPVGAALELPAAQLGVTTEQLFASGSESLLSTTGKLSSKLGNYTGAGAAAQQVMNAIQNGNISDIVNSVLGVLGVPIQIPGGTKPPAFQPPPQSTQTRQDAAGAGLLSGGGYSNPTYVTDPAAVNIPMYIAGAGLLIVLGIMIFRGKG